MEDSLEGPFALTFTPTSIFASRLNASGSIEVTKHPASLAWQTYYHNAIRDFGLSQTPTYQHHHLYEDTAAQEEFISWFRDAVAPVTETLTQQLGHAPYYSAVIVPSVFVSSVHFAANKALWDREEGRELNRGSSCRIACYGLGFLEGKHVNRAPKERSDNAPPETLILVLEYEEEYMHAALEIIFWDFKVYYRPSDDQYTMWGTVSWGNHVEILFSDAQAEHIAGGR